MRKNIEKIIYQEQGGKVPSLETIHKLLLSIPDEETKYFAIITYLYAGRISEICKYKNLKTKEKKLGIKKIDFSIRKRKEKKYLILNLRNEKNPTQHNKILPSRIEKEKKIVKPLLEYLKRFKEEEELFPHYRKYYYLKLKNNANNWCYYPHYLRALRLSHLVIYYKFNEQMLVKFAGWTDSRPARFYMLLSAEDLMGAMSNDNIC